MSTADDAFKERPLADPAAGAMELTDAELSSIAAGEDATTIIVDDAVPMLT